MATEDKGGTVTLQEDNKRLKDIIIMGLLALDHAQEGCTCIPKDACNWRFRVNALTYADQ